jgi:hypothetical protein
MEGMAPSPAEATVVTVLTAVGVLIVLGLLAGLVVWRKTVGRAAPPAVRTKAGGLWLLTAIGVTALFFGGRVSFVRNVAVDRSSLLELHGTGAPVYWIAYLVGSSLLVLLVTTLLKRRQTLRWVLGPPALLAAGLAMALLMVLLWKIERFDARVAAARMPGVTPGDGLSDASIGVEPQIGFWLGFAGVTILGLVVVLLLADRYELTVAIAAAAIVTLAAGPIPPDTSFWGLRADGRVEQVWYSAFDIGGPMLLPTLVYTLLAGLLVVIPILPRWVRGIVAFLVVLGPVWLALAGVATYPTYEAELPVLLRDDGYVAEVRRLGIEAYLLMVAAMAALPVAAVRGWRAGRRANPRADRAPRPERIGNLSGAAVR